MTWKEAQDAGFIQALLDGKTLQRRHNNQWCESEIMHDLCYASVGNIRIKPEKKRVPLTAEDLPPVFWVKIPEDDEWRLVVTIDKGSLYLACYGKILIQTLRSREAVWSTDRKIEHPFWKEIEG